jgi:hypothetical protein
MHWAVSFIFRGRSQRTTTRQQIVARTMMARLSATEEALKAQQGQEQIESGKTAAADVSGAAGDAGDNHAEKAGTDSVDELTAAYGDTRAEERDAAPLKQAPES